MAMTTSCFEYTLLTLVGEHRGRPFYTDTYGHFFVQCRASFGPTQTLKVVRVLPDDTWDGTFRDDYRATYVIDHLIRLEEIELVHANDCLEAFDHPVQVTLQRVGPRVIYIDSAQRIYRLECCTSSRCLSTDVVTLVGEPKDRCYMSITGTELYFLTCGLPYDPRPTQRPTSSRSALPPLDTVPTTHITQETTARILLT
ncbi:hypothetical protein GOP47_0013219 [Adiantum capillus-veneris]|uniref:Uncharacterized protein n=1 Tax=Adiantum capillus-veneris TaxID=13818 RepID=A0A9D4UPD1_ADICA|nr:hypothetical protein GOP47_0013219 [Adiantum capillus-veneris]